MHDVSKRNFFISVHDLKGSGGCQTSDERCVGSRTAGAGRRAATRD